MQHLRAEAVRLDAFGSVAAGGDTTVRAEVVEQRPQVGECLGHVRRGRGRQLVEVSA